MKTIKLTDEQWKLFSLYLKRNNKSKAGRPQRIDDKIAFEGVIYVLKTGIPWRYLPKEFGAWQTVYKLFARWAKSGALEHFLLMLRIFHAGGKRYRCCPFCKAHTSPDRNDFAAFGGCKSFFPFIQLLVKSRS